MEYEGKFTEDDVDNDGEIKSYAGKQAAQVASRQNSDLYRMFVNVCEEKGLEPWEVLGDHIVRALNNEDHAGMLANTEVNMSKLKQGNIRVEDAKLLREFAEELGVGFGDSSSDDELEEIFKARLKSKLESPFSSVAGGGSDVTDESLKDEVRMLRSEIQSMKDGDGSQQRSQPEQNDGGGQADKAIDDVFDEAMSDSDEGGGDVETEESVDVDLEEEEPDDGLDMEFEGDDEEDDFKLDPVGVPDEPSENIPGSDDAEVDDGE